MVMNRWMALVWMAGACGEPRLIDESDSGDAPTVAEADYPAVHADVLCDLQIECACETPLPEDECREILGRGIESSVATSSDSGLAFDPVCAGEAIDAASELGCGSIVDVPPASCSPCPLYHGSGKVGETCTVFDDGRYDDCDRGLRCDGAVCFDPCTTVGEGEDCSSQQCGPGLFCAYTDPDEEEHGNEPTAACMAAAQLGEACSTSLLCDVGLACSNAAECIEWAGGQSGDPCMYGCAEGLLCDTTVNGGGGECRPRGITGDPCIGAADCASGRCGGSSKCLPEQPAACLG
jgi:hypothetical protein